MDEEDDDVRFTIRSSNYLLCPHVVFFYLLIGKCMMTFLSWDTYSNQFFLIVEDGWRRQYSPSGHESVARGRAVAR